MSKRSAIYAGSFDPLTNGHLSVLRAGLALFDRVTVAIGTHAGKKGLFAFDERESLIRAALDEAGRIPLEPDHNPRCPNLVRYEMMKRLGYFVTESSEHFAEYVPWFIKRDRPDLIERFRIPLDEYPKRCVEQQSAWAAQYEEYRSAETIGVEPSHEYASDIINSVWSGEPSVIYGNVPNHRLIDGLPDGCAVEVPCLVDANGVRHQVIAYLALDPKKPQQIVQALYLFGFVGLGLRFPTSAMRQFDEGKGGCRFGQARPLRGGLPGFRQRQPGQKQGISHLETSVAAGGRHGARIMSRALPVPAPQREPRGRTAGSGVCGRDGSRR